MTMPRKSVLALVSVVAMAWAIYRPEIRRPFDFVDFPETLLILQQHDGFVPHVVDLTKGTLVHARLNLFVYVLIAAKWALFGWWTPGWQLARFATMSAAVVLTFALLRRLRMSALGSLIGASVFVVAPAAVRGWIRLTAAEPVVTVCVLAAALLATYYQTSDRRRLIGSSLAILAVVVVTTKEVLAVAYALPLALLLMTHPDGQLGPPRIDRSNRKVLAGIATAIVVALIPSVWVYLTAPVASYGRWFGTASPSVFDLLAMTIAGLLPFLPASTGWGMVLVNVGFWGLVLTGLPLVGRDREQRGHFAWLLFLAIALPWLGGLVYLPWPNFQLVYALPFLFGQALLVAMAVTMLGNRSRSATRVAVGLWCLVLTYAIPEAATEARRVEAIQVATSLVLPRVARQPGVDSVLVVAPQTVLDQRGLFGPRLFLYAQATGRSWPPTRDVSCEEGLRAASSLPSVVVVWSTFMCGESPGGGEVIRTDYQRVDWRGVRVVRDSMRFDVLRAREASGRILSPPAAP